MGLSGRKKEKLQEAIVAAFSPEEFERFSVYRLDKNFINETPYGTFLYRVFQFIELAEREIWTGKLVEALRKEKPDHCEIASFAADYSVSAATRLAAHAEDAKAYQLDDYWPWIRYHTSLEKNVVVPNVPPVFVELALDPHLNHLNRSAELSDRRCGGLDQLLELNYHRHPKVTGRWILCGTPGSGKTRLLRRFATELARARDPARIPLFFSLPQLMDRSTFLERVEQEICRRRPRARGLAAELELAGTEGRLVVLLDGFDEVGEPSQDDARDFLQALGETWSQSAIFVSSRPVERLRIPGFRKVDLLPLDRGRKVELLARLLDEADASKAEGVLDRLEGDLGLRQLTGNPLNLTLLTALVRAGEEPDRDRLAFYSRSIDRLLAGADRPHSQILPRTRAAGRALSYLALDLVRKDREIATFAELEDMLYEMPAARRRPLESVKRWRDDLGLFLKEVASRTGILIREGISQENWRFLHPIFREALAAKALAEELELTSRPETGAGVPWSRLNELAFVHGGKERQWSEVFALLIAREPEPDAAIETLVREHPRLGLQALATVRGLRDKTLETVLDLTSDWRQRRKVIEQAVDHVGDPERCIHLLDRLRETTRRGTDLYFIEAALRQIADRWPEHGDLIRQVLEHLFDHIDPPAPHLFERITVGDRREFDNWRRVPPGTLLLGDGAGSHHERPVRRVVFGNGFRLAATPVTRRQYACFDPTHEGAWLEDLPVVQVTWFEAVAFCRWLAQRGTRLQGARLPMEIEWEHACRYRNAESPWWCRTADRLREAAWFRDNSNSRIHPVGRREPSPLGLYDLHGNVREWCWDVWTDDHSHRPPESKIRSLDPLPLSDADAGRVLRGGCFLDPAADLRSTARAASRPYLQSDLVGFRVLLPGLGTGETSERDPAPTDRRREEK